MGIVENWIDRKTNHWFRKETEEGFVLGGIFGRDYTSFNDRWFISVIADDKCHRIWVPKDNPCRDLQIIKSKINNLLKGYKSWRPWWKSIKNIPPIITASFTDFSDEPVSFTSKKVWFYFREKIILGKFVYKPNDGMYVHAGKFKERLTIPYTYLWCDKEDIHNIKFKELHRSDDDLPF